MIAMYVYVISVRLVQNIIPYNTIMDNAIN
jgi:hypothetical protein